MTYMRDRLLAQRLASMKTSTLLLGPRQVGKSTLCRALAPALYVDLADQREFLSYAKDPGRLSREVAALTRPALVVCDEVQRVPALLNTVQSLVDRSGRGLRFVLTGSSARKLRRGGANLLPGRVILERLDPLSTLELEHGFDFDRGLRLGMLPGIYWGDAEAEDVLGTYADVYLREEVQVEGAARDLGSYARFLDVMAITSGQWLNYSKLASDTEIPKETIRRFVQILDDTLLAFRVPAFVPRVRTSRRVLQRERVFLFDVGVRNALLGVHRRPLAPDRLGDVFEHWTILQLIYLSHALRKGWRFSSYRSEGGAEVDVIIEDGRHLIAIEVKAGRTVSRADTRGLASLAELVGHHDRLERWIVYRGERRQRFDDGVEVWPVLEAIDALRDR
jgi:predicted AAA+ superfamily ATPase